MVTYGRFRNLRRVCDLALRAPRRLLAALAVVAGTLAGCSEVREYLTPAPPDIAADWSNLLNEVRAFEQKIGFRDTENFRAFSGEHEAFPFCGYVSRLYLPYSYEDAAIRWLDPVTEAECIDAGHNADVYYGEVEAWGESASPVTPSMIASKLDRFLYLVIHEDCHDQFDLPFGIEEPLCNVIAYHAMVSFGKEKYGYFSRAHWAVRRYAEIQTAQTRSTVTYYEQLAELYARHSRNEISADALLQARADVFTRAERALARQQGELNNVVMGNEMTYSRHYPYLESVYRDLEHNLVRMVALFRQVDRAKPSRSAVMKEQRIATEKSVDFIRAYEAAVLETTRKALAESGAGR